MPSGKQRQYDFREERLQAAIQQLRSNRYMPVVEASSKNSVLRASLSVRIKGRLPTRESQEPRKILTKAQERRIAKSIKRYEDDGQPLTRKGAKALCEQVFSMKPRFDGVQPDFDCKMDIYVPRSLWAGNPSCRSQELSSYSSKHHNERDSKTVGLPTSWGRMVETFRQMH